MKDKHLKSKIRMPILMLIIIVPLLTLLLFNICFRLYTAQEAKKELQIMSKTMETVVKKEFNENTNLSTNKIETAFQKLYRTMKLSKLITDTEILLYNRTQQLIYPNDTSGSFLTENIITEIGKKIPQFEQNKVQVIQINGAKYDVLCYHISSNDGTKPAILFISQTNQTKTIVVAMNIILIVIMLIGTAIAAIIVNRISSHIAKPVTTLTELTKQIGGGDFSIKIPDHPGDILEINQLYQSVHDMNAKLFAYDQTQKTFLQNASHELRTPLMSIQGYAEGIEKGIVPDVIHAAEIISSESKRLNTLVDELLTLSRIEAGIYHNDMTIINLNNVMQDYKQRLSGYANKLNHDIILNLSDLPINIIANDSLLSQCIINIVSNCLRFAKSKVTISIFTQMNSAVIRISDDGDGISEQDLPYIFQRFYKGKDGNLGLGLAIAKSSIDLMNGTIRAYNDEVGAVFELLLPLSK